MVKQGYKIIKNGNNYYEDNNIKRKINKHEWEKIRKGRQPIPPAYKKVEIYPYHPKIWAKGYDEAGRLQVLYQPQFRQNQERLKFKDLIDFGKKWENILRKLKKEADENPVAMCILLMIDCNFRVGSKNNSNHKGASTATLNHVKYISNNNKIQVSFIGKKGVLNQCYISDPQLIEYFKKLKNDPNLNKNRPLFCIDGRKVRAEDINKYLFPYTSKYIRTWTANLELLELLYSKNNFEEYKKTESQTKIKKLVNKIVDDIAISHHHTRSICKKAYIYPILLNKILNKDKDILDKPKNINNYLINLLQQN